MYRMWKRLLIVAIILLVSCSAFGGYLWYQLNVIKNQLANTETRLANTVVELDNTKVRLADTENLLDTTKTQLVDTEAQLGTTKAQLDITKTQLETVKNENSQMLNQYAGLKGQINVRLALTLRDRQSFITPSDSLVSAKVQEITGGYSGDVNKYWRDCEKMYRWVVKNITYSHDSYMPILPSTISGELVWSQECWRMPEETLGDETGDCEDMAVLLASMLRSYNEGQYRIWVLSIHSDVPEVKGHLAVAFPVKDGKLTILDPAGNCYTGYQYGSLGADSASVAVKNWLSRWNSEMPGAEIVTAFSEDSYHQFSSTAEFLTWLE